MRRLAIISGAGLAVLVIALAHAGAEEEEPTSTSRPTTSTAPATTPSEGVTYKGVKVDDEWIARAYKWNKDKIVKNSSGEFVTCRGYRGLSHRPVQPGIVYRIPGAMFPNSIRPHPFKVTATVPKELDPKRELLAERGAFRYGRIRAGKIHWIDEPKWTLHIRSAAADRFGGGTIVPQGTLLLPRGRFIYGRHIINSYEHVTRITKDQLIEYLKSGKDLPVPVHLPETEQPPAASQPTIPEGSPKDLDGRIQLAENYIHNELPKKARVILEKLIEDFPESKQAKKARKLLSKL